MYFVNVSLYVFSVSYPPYGTEASASFHGKAPEFSMRLAEDMVSALRRILQEYDKGDTGLDAVNAVRRVLQLSGPMLATSSFVAWLYTLS